MENFNELYEKKYTFDDNVSSIKEASINLDKLALIVAKVDELEDQNDHTGIMTYISKILGYRKYNKIFEGIEDMHKIFGYLHPSLYAFRNSMKYELFQEIKKNYGIEVAETLLGSEKFVKDYQHYPIK